MKKALLLLTSILALTSCGTGGSIHAYIMPGDDTPFKMVGPIASSFNSNTYYKYIVINFAFADTDASLTVNTSDFRAEKEGSTLEAITFIDSVQYSSKNDNTHYYVISSSSYIDLKYEDGYPPSPAYVAFDTALDFDYSFYYKNIKLTPGEYIPL